MDGATLKLIITFLLGLLPISEVRGALPFALINFQNTPLLYVGVLIAVVGNLLVAPVVFFGLSFAQKILPKYKILRPFNSIYKKVIRYGENKAKKVGNLTYLGLAIFVGVPFPLTGAWTGALIAFVLGLNKKKSLIAIEAGVIIAALIVFLASFAGIEILKQVFFLS